MLVPAIVLFTATESQGLLIAAIVLFGILYAPGQMARGGASNGQTFGKQIAGIRVVHESGQPMDFAKGVIRDFIGKTVLGYAPLPSLVDSLFPLADGRNQAIHPQIGSTTVPPGLGGPDRTR